MSRYSWPRALTALWPIALAYLLFKVMQVILYPDPYLIGDTEELLLSAMSLDANPYKPMGYSLFLAAVRPLAVAPIGVPIIQALLRLIATLALGAVLLRELSMTRRWVLGVCALVAFDPVALVLDHYLLTHSVFVSCSIGFLAALLAYSRAATWTRLAVCLVLAVAALLVRYVGFAYPVLLLLATLRYRRRPLLAQSIVVAASTALVVTLASLHVERSLGIFRTTAFDGFALYGNLAPLLDFETWSPAEVEDAEVGLVAAYLSTFPRETYSGHNTHWHRWYPESPAKQLMSIFVANEMPDSRAAWTRNRDFLTAYLEMAKGPVTPSQRLFQRFVEKNADAGFSGYYQMEYRQAFVFTNELLRRFGRAFLRDHWGEFLRAYYVRSLARLFWPGVSMINEGAYTFREYPDGSVTRFWPPHDTRDWRPRAGDPLAALGRLHPFVAPAGWLAALIGLGVAILRRVRESQRVATLVTHPGTLLIAFAVCFGAAVAFSHMTVVRYTTPILPFLWVGASLLATDRPRPVRQEIVDL